MVFSSAIFLFCFLPITLIGYYLLDRRFKNYFLLLVSLVFYAWGEPVFVFVMLASIFVNYLLALGIDAAHVRSGERPKLLHLKKLLLLVSVLLNLSLFFIYKYLDFTIVNINTVAGWFGADWELPLKGIALPIGISFFTFQAMSYVFDVYYRKGEVQKNPFNAALYISLFPQLIAGPIVRYQTVADQIRERKETLDGVAHGIRRFIVGLAKKVIISNTVAVLADYAFDSVASGTTTVALAWLGAVAYTLQIYFDFSGYSDMAIGLGKMFGFDFLENFDHPYCSKTVSEFWRRWHISLGSWFRDYVYFPLGGSRVESKLRLVFNLFVVWFLTGVWHGANWTFIIWGLMYFVLLTFEKLTGIAKKLDKPYTSIPYRVFTLLCVMVGWVFFRAADVSQAVSYLGCMFGAAPHGGMDGATEMMLLQYLPVIIIGIIFSINIRELFAKSKLYADNKELLDAPFMRTIGDIILMVLAVVAISFTVASTYNPFIYFNF